jgi:CubicO group peptidase (beta-lactamase class C family)
MNTATLLLKQADPALMTTPHTANPAGRLIVSPVFPYNREHAPSSTLYASALDTARFALAYLNGGELDGARILSPETINEMWKPAFATGSEFWKQIGLSWFIGERQGYKTVGHDGEDDGFTTTLVLAPDAAIGVILLSNRDAAGIEYLGDDLLDLLLAPSP